MTLRDARDVKEVLALMRGEEVLMRATTVSITAIHRDVLERAAGTEEARRQMEHEGQAEIRMRLDRKHPPRRYLGTDVSA